MWCASSDSEIDFLRVDVETGGLFDGDDDDVVNGLAMMSCLDESVMSLVDISPSPLPHDLLASPTVTFQLVPRQSTATSCHAVPDVTVKQKVQSLVRSRLLRRGHCLDDITHTTSTQPHARKVRYGIATV